MASTRSRRASPAAMAVAACLLSITGCATAPEPMPVSADGEGPLLTTGGAYTVIDRDGAVALCTSVLQSYPPVCGGAVALSGWEWDAVPAAFETASGVRWGEYVVTGRYDAEVGSLAVASVGPPPKETPADPAGPIVPSACQEPEGGWQVTDPDRATQQALGSASALAAELDGFGRVWVDRSMVPPAPVGADPLAELDWAAAHVDRQVLNVALRGDLAAAERILAEAWGGPLCVSATAHTAAEIEAMQAAVMADAGADLLLSTVADPAAGTIHLLVAHDAGGALQSMFDETYGPGAVEVSSVLGAG